MASAGVAGAHETAVQHPRPARTHKRILSKDVPADEDPFRFFFELFPSAKVAAAPAGAVTKAVSPPPAPAPAPAPAGSTQKRANGSAGDGQRPRKLQRITNSDNNVAAAQSTQAPTITRSDNAPADETSKSRQSKQAPPAVLSSPPVAAPPAPAAAPQIVHSFDLVVPNARKYAKWFTETTDEKSGSPASSHNSSPSQSASIYNVPTDEELQSLKVELMYCNKAFKETFSLLRPRSVIRQKANLHNTLSNPSAVRAGTPDPSDPEYDPVEDLIATVRALVENALVVPPANVLSTFTHEQTGIIRRLERARNRQNLLKFTRTIDEFNQELGKCRKEGYVLGYTKKRLNAPDVSADIKAAIRNQINDFASPGLVAHILDQSYARTVAPHADKLTKYQPFSNEVYGEVNPIFVSMILNRVKLKPDQTFVDLGSGIGNVVLQMAAQSGCNAVGVEIQRIASELAQAQLNEYRARMRFFNKRHGNIALHHGDMLDHPDISSALLSRADVIFVNNYVFSPELNQGILQKFLDLKEGARVVSLKSFVPHEYKLSLRNVDNIASIFEVEAFEYPRGYVSWTDQGGTWYVQTVNRARVEEFLRSAA
ncbi:Nucleosomal histone H3-Lys79 methylase [Sorochytrium milnesiophthora]